MKELKNISRETLIKSLAWYYESIGEQVVGDYSEEVGTIAEICHKECEKNNDWKVCERSEKINKILYD